MNDITDTPKTILIVEDDAIIRDVLREILTMEGYRVVVAANGKEGLKELHKIPTPQLVLLDLLMPVMSGREFLDNVLTDTVVAPIPVLILSASTDSINTQGAVKVMKKPVDLEILLKFVAAYIS